MKKLRQILVAGSLAISPACASDLNDGNLKSGVVGMCSPEVDGLPELGELEKLARLDDELMGEELCDLIREFNVNSLCALLRSACDEVEYKNDFNDSEYTASHIFRCDGPVNGLIECSENISNEDGVKEVTYGCSFYAKDDGFVLGDYIFEDTYFWAGFNPSAGEWDWAGSWPRASVEGGDFVSPISEFLRLDNGDVNGYVGGPISYEVSGSFASCGYKDLETTGGVVKDLALHFINKSE